MLYNICYISSDETFRNGGIPRGGPGFKRHGLQKQRSLEVVSFASFSQFNNKTSNITIITSTTIITIITITTTSKEPVSGDYYSLLSPPRIGRFNIVIICANILIHV